MRHIRPFLAAPFKPNRAAGPLYNAFGGSGMIAGRDIAVECGFAD